MNDIHENTICHKIHELQDALEKVIKTGELDLNIFTKNLEYIRKSAQKMENGLKLRKEVMQLHDIEEEYQAKKKAKDIPTGINTVQNAHKKTKEKIKFRITVEEQGKIVYQNESFGAVVSVVEKIKDIDNFGVIDGQAQTFFAGHPLTVFFAFDQLHQAYQSKNIEITAAIKEAILNNKFSDPRVKKQIIDFMNNK
jgi:hypothetical protein